MLLLEHNIKNPDQSVLQLRTLQLLNLDQNEELKILADGLLLVSEEQQLVEGLQLVGHNRGELNFLHDAHGHKSERELDFRVARFGTFEQGLLWVG